MGGKGSLETLVIQMVEIRFTPGWIFETLLGIVYLAVFLVW